MIMKKYYKDFKIKYKIFFVTLLLLLIFSLIGMLTFNYFSSLYEKRIYDEAAEVLQVTSSILDEEISKIEKLSFQIATDDFIQEDLRRINKNKYSYEMYQIKSALINRLESIVNSEQYLTSVRIEDTNDITYTAGYLSKIYDRIQKEDFQKIHEAKGANVWLSLDGHHLLTSSRMIRNKKNLDLTTLGILHMTIDLYRLIDSNLDFSANKNFIIKKGDQIIYTKDESLYFDENIGAGNVSGYEIAKINGEDFFVTYKQSRHSDLVYYNILPFEQITEQTKIYKILMVFVFLLLLLLTIILSYRAAKGISEPLEQLTYQIKRALNTNMSSPEMKFFPDEITDLSINFQRMLEEIDELNRKNYEKQIVIKESEYRALQAQINPHFLYNTLDSINWLAQIHQQEKIATMTEALGNMMRNIISKRTPLITVQEELEIVHNYLTIQKHRYYERLKFSINDYSSYKHNHIPKLTIQPIVENAIKHGLEEIAKPCHIVITIRDSEHHLKIEIEDNGPGMEKDTIQSILNNLIETKGKGIGLYNINERIKLLFGDEFGLEIDSVKGEGTKVNILLPLTEEVDGDL